MMDISGLIQSQAYDQRDVTSAAMARVIVAPQYGLPVSYTTTCTTGMVHRQAQPQQSLYGDYTYNAVSNIGLPTMDYLQRRPQSQMMNPPLAVHPGMTYSSPTPRQSFISEQQSADYTYVKSESECLPNTLPSWDQTNSSQYLHAATTSTEPAEDANFGTDVDTLMRAIQSKLRPESPTPPHPSPITASRPASQQPKAITSSTRGSSNEDLSENPKKRYECHVGDCRKGFCQKTHLAIHIRAHTGVKPYACRYANCAQRFSQLGNLKTHERRHSGERPYSCDLCGKRFAQRGNVRAHRSVHAAHKPFECRLDACGKAFTQLGNLKSHQNKFHLETLRELTRRFEGGGAEGMEGGEAELFRYFAGLYKNSNKGIKGRGKGRKVAGAGAAAAAAGGGEVGFGAAAAREGFVYDFAAREESDSGASSRSGSSSTGSIYGVDPGEGYEDEGGELAFGDRMY